MEEALLSGFVAAALAFAVARLRRDLAFAPLRLAGEAGALGLAAGLALALLAPEAGWRGAILLGWLAPLSLIDARRMILPDPLTLPLVLLGLALGLAERDFAPALSAALGWGALAGLAWAWPRAGAQGSGALGAGDAKLLAGIGAWLGPFALPEVVFIAAVSGIVFALVAKKGRDAEIPFGPALAFGALASMLFGPVF